jgi:hypothetical protein
VNLRKYSNLKTLLRIIATPKLFIIATDRFFEGPDLCRGGTTSLSLGERFHDQLPAIAMDGAMIREAMVSIRQHATTFDAQSSSVVIHDFPKP